MISINRLMSWVDKYKFGKYIAIDELRAICKRMAKMSLEDKLTLQDKAELNEKKKERLYEELKNDS